MSISDLSTQKPSRYFTRADLQQHHTVDSAWVSIYRDVYDITAVIRENRTEPGIDNLLRFIGKDMSHLFNIKTKRPITKNSVLVEELGPKDPNYVLHFPKNYMHSEKESTTQPWYTNSKLIVGRMSEKEVSVRLINTLTYEEDILVVPIEETLNEICERYLKYNLHARSYTWKDIEERVLNMSFNLIKNKIAEDYELLDYLDITADNWPIPTIFLHFNDDLTEM